MPSPYIPVRDVTLLKLVLVDAFGIALIAYVISLSLARIMASKHRYQVLHSQHLIFFCNGSFTLAMFVSKTVGNSNT
jgi:hypothetical protein